MNRTFKNFWRFFVSPFAFAFILLSFSIISSTLPIQTYAESTPVIISSTPRTLKLNMTGDDVKSLQVYLNTHGFPLALSGVGSKGHETTTFGPLTKKAVILFQKANNLTPDGIVGPLTRKYINGDSIPNVISKLPAGCKENTTFSTTTGLLCNTSIKPQYVIYINHNVVYTLTYTAGSNGTLTGDLSQKVEQKSHGTMVTAVPNTGYHFVNWSDLSTTNPRTDTNVSANKSVTANFEVNAPISYTITFDSAGGSAVSSITADYGTSITPPSDPTKAGYTFAGWSPSILGTMPVGGQSLTATWGANDNTVSFNGNGNTGGSTTAQSIQTGNTALLTTNGFTRTGYTFTGWNTLANGTGTAYANGANYTMGVSGIVIYAEWSINSYTLTLNANDGTLGGTSAGSIVYNTLVTITQTPPTGYSFAEWTGGTCSGAGSCSFNMPASDVTVNATYTINTFTITASSGSNGTVTPTGATSKDYGSSQTYTITPSSNYHVVDVLVDSASVGAVTTYDFTNITTNHTISATFATDTYTVTFNGNTNTGGSTATQTLNYNTPTALTSNGYTKTGYTFAGWATTSGGVVAYINGASYTIGAGNVTLYAKWTTATYTVTFNGNTNTGGATATQTLVYNTPTALTSNGFTRTCSSSFAGWATTSGGVVAYADGASYTIGAGNVNLYAKWTVATPDCYTLRSTGPGGGSVFYTTNGGLHGLEAAPTNQSTGIMWAITAYQSTSAGTSTAIGTGSANTDLIIAQNGGTTPYTYAAGKARACIGCTGSDWFLPSKDELNKMYINLKSGTDENSVVYAPVGSFSSEYYWSSSEIGSTIVWRQYLDGGNQSSNAKSVAYYVRAVRAF